MKKKEFKKYLWEKLLRKFTSKRIRYVSNKQNTHKNRGKIIIWGILHVVQAALAL